MKKLTKSALICLAFVLSFSMASCSQETGSRSAQSTEAETSAATQAAESSQSSQSSENKSGFLSKVTASEKDVSKIEFQSGSPLEIETAAAKPYSVDINLQDYEGLNLDVDERGAYTMDSSVLFEYDSAELTSKGKESLKGFLDEYAKQIFKDGTASVSKITVEGHTDTDGDYDYNKELSQKRADNVMKYSIELHPEFKDLMTAVGCSYDNPVKKADGTVDKAASRRVCFVAE